MAKDRTEELQQRKSDLEKAWVKEKVVQRRGSTIEELIQIRNSVEKQATTGDVSAEKINSEKGRLTERAHELYL